MMICVCAIIKNNSMNIPNLYNAIYTINNIIRKIERLFNNYESANGNANGFVNSKV